MIVGRVAVLHFESTFCQHARTQQADRYLEYKMYVHMYPVVRHPVSAVMHTHFSLEGGNPLHSLFVLRLEVRVISYSLVAACHYFRC